MISEDKNILLKDLCARIPNHVKVELHGEICTCLGYFDDFVMLTSNTPMGQQTNIANVKPYLRPLSSMTEDEREEIEVFIFNEWYQENSCKIDKEGWIEILANYDVSGIDPCFCSDYVDWLNAHHFDYRGLIEKGLAIEAPEEIYKTE